MKRLAVVFLVTLAALVAAAPSAQAAPPTHEQVPINDTFTDESCGFPVQVHVTGFMLVIEWVDEDGTIRRFEGFPQARTTFRNSATGRASRLAPPGRLTSPTIQTGALPRWARGPGDSLTIPRPVSRESSCCRAAGSSSRRRATHPSASSARRSTSVQSWPLERSTGCGCPALGRRACVEDHLRPVTGGTDDSPCRRLGSPQSSQEVPAETQRSPPEPAGGRGHSGRIGVREGSGDLGGGRRQPGGPVWPLEVPVRDAVAHRPRPVGISAQARSVTAGAGLAFGYPAR